MAYPTGAGAKLALRKETTFGTVATGNYELAPFASFSLAAQEELLENDMMGTGREALRPERQPGDLSGRAVVPIDLNSIGHWLNMLFGAATTTGTGPYTHVWKSGASALNSYSIEQQHTDVTPNVFFMNAGVYGNSFQVGWEPQGRATMTIDLIGKAQTRSGTSGAGTVTTTSLTRFSQFHGKIKRDGVDVARILRVSPNFTNNLEIDRYVGGAGAIGDIGLGIATIRGELVARFSDATLYDLAVNETVFDLELIFERNAGERITFSLEQAELGKSTPAIEGPGGLSQTFQLVGSKDVAEGNMLTVTLVTPDQQF